MLNVSSKECCLSLPFYFLIANKDFMGMRNPSNIDNLISFLLKLMNIFERLDKLYFLESLYSYAYLASSKNSNRNYSAEKS